MSICIGALAALLVLGGINLLVLAWASKHAPIGTEIEGVGFVRSRE